MIKHIVSFSGGKDSTAMLLRMIQEKMQIDEIIFCDTSVEFPEMYKHIEKINKYIKKKIGFGITTLKAEHNFEYYLLDYVKKRGKNKGQKGYSFPDHSSRWCTRALKTSVMNKYMKKYKDFEVIEYVGIAFDEQNRIGKNNPKEKLIRYPLNEWKMTESECLEYCYQKGYNWDGLYKKFNRLSCWCCPLSRLGELKILWKEYPILWQKLETWESKTYRKFRRDYSIPELHKKFRKEERKNGKNIKGNKRKSK